VFNILAPIFGLIALAYASRKVNVLGPSAYIDAVDDPVRTDALAMPRDPAAHPLEASDRPQRAALSARIDAAIIEQGGAA
jgi:hypothetical protein